MSKLKFYIITIVTVLCYTVSFSQDRQYIYIDNLESEAVSYSIASNYEGASFYIYYKGYETKTKRDSIRQMQIKERKDNRYKLHPPIPSTGINYYTSNPPEKLSSLESITIISPKEYREHKIYEKKPRYTYIITPCKDGGYLKWRVIMLGSK